MPDPTAPLYRPASEQQRQKTSEACRNLIAQIGAEVAGPLGAAMERIHILTGTGRIDRKGLRALRSEVEAARQVGILSQQIARLAGGDLSQSPETLQLTPIVRGVLTQRSRDIDTRGVQVRQFLAPVDIVADAPLLFSLLNTLLDWSLANAASPIEWRTDVSAEPAHPRLHVHFSHAGAHRLSPEDTGSSLDSMVWHLLEHTAGAMGALVTRQVGGTNVQVSIEFPPPVAETIPPRAPANTEVSPVDTPAPPDYSAPPSPAMLKPLVGSHVLVAVATRELRRDVREATRPLGMIVDFVESVDEAAAFCRDGLPHALVWDSSMRGPACDQLRRDLLVEAPDLVFIEILRAGDDGADHASPLVPTISEGSIGARLPGLLATELTRALHR